jgi:hypothetical protein
MNKIYFIHFEIIYDITHTRMSLNLEKQDRANTIIVINESLVLIQFCCTSCQIFAFTFQQFNAALFCDTSCYFPEAMIKCLKSIALYEMQCFRSMSMEQVTQFLLYLMQGNCVNLCHCDVKVNKNKRTANKIINETNLKQAINLTCASFLFLLDFFGLSCALKTKR